MVKKKGSRDINPADAHRKAQRAKEIARNKKERKFQRDAQSLQANPDAIKDELKEVLALEEEGKGNQTVRLKKKALQGAYDHAVKKRKEEQLKKLQPTDELAFSTEGGHGVLQRRPEDSVYYHPMLNPTGVPPPGKPQRYKTGVSSAATNVSNLPKPKPPPLPAGPAPSQPGSTVPLAPPPRAALPPGPAPGTEPAEPSRPLPPPSGAPPNQLLPPPSGPPPGAERPNGALPPPAGPPPGRPPAGFWPGMMPPPRGPPPGMAPLGPPPGAPPGMRPMMPPPNYPPPGHVMPPPAGPPPGVQQVAPAKEHKEAKPTIQAASTVVRIPRADQDKTVTAMVPASLRHKKAVVQPKLKRVIAVPNAAPSIGASQDAEDSYFIPAVAPTAAPQVRPSAAAKNRPKGVFDSKYEDFMQEMAGLGALES